MRFRNIDLFKGLLIVFVISGHILLGKVNESILKTMIYSFHMPVFIAISGFLCNLNKLLKTNCLEIIKKYLFRIIIPWTLAVIVYFLLTAIKNHHFNALELIKAFITPIYHLWYIPGLLSWIILSLSFKRLKISNTFLLGIALIISIISFYLVYYPVTYQGFGIISTFTEAFLYTFRPYFYVFFVLGFVYRNLELNIPKTIDYVLPLVFFILVPVMYYAPNKALKIINFLLFNTFLIHLILKVVSNNALGRVQIIEWMGLNSLGLYLWHVIPILICKHYIGTENLVYYYTATILSVIAFIVLYKYLSRIQFLKTYFFGM
ncbi:acyltransferase family protein [Psychroserpens sp. MEBiC05023]